MLAERHKILENVIKVTISSLAFGLVTCARQEVTLLSEELLNTRISGSTLSSLRLLCTLCYIDILLYIA